MRDRIAIPFRRRASLGVLALALAGCAAASPIWVHADRPPDRWRADESLCRREAATEIERDYVIERQGASQPGVFGPPGAGGADVLPDRSLAGNLDRVSLERQRSALIADCMRRMGYRRAGD